MNGLGECILDDDRKELIRTMAAASSSTANGA